MMTPEEQLRTEQSLKECATKTGEDVDDGLGMLMHHAESTLYLGLIQILNQNLRYTRT